MKKYLYKATAVLLVLAMMTGMFAVSASASDAVVPLIEFSECSEPCDLCELLEHAEPTDFYILWAVFVFEIEPEQFRVLCYDPYTLIGTSPDTYWNPGNMIYGDNPRKINERQDALGLNIYTYAPDIEAIRQSGNLYVYCMNNPLMYVDPSGNLSLSLVHNWVVADIHAKYAAVGMTSNKMIDYSGFGFGFADLVSLNTGEVWEVKKSTVSVTSAIKQLANYTTGQLHNKDLRALAPQLYTGGSQGTVIAMGSMVKTVGFDTYYVNYWDNGNGIIQYDYNRVTNWQAVGNAMVGVVVLAGVTYLIVQSGGALAPVLVPAAAAALGG